MLLMLAWPFLGRWVRQQGKQGSPALNSQEQESMGAGSWSEALVGKGQTSLAPPAPRTTILGDCKRENQPRERKHSPLQEVWQFC